MDKVKNFLLTHSVLVYSFLLFVVVLIGGAFFKGHYNNLLTDFGREMLFPEAILNGKILYKDILCIYFPLAYQINALGYKIFGVNLSVIEWFGVVNSCIFILSIFFISKEFLSKTTSFLIALVFAFAAVFNGTLFNFILPYSTSITYGITAYMVSVFCIIKYFKNTNGVFLCLAYLFAGFALACKSEFVFLFVLLVLCSAYLKPCSLKQNVLNIFLYSLFLLLSFGALFVQGLNFSEFFAAFAFMKNFFTTESMMYHIARTGGIFSISNFGSYFISIICFSVFCLVSLFLFKVSKNNILLAISVLISAFLLNNAMVWLHFVLLPLLVFFVFAFKFKEIFTDKALFCLVIAALFLNIRMFWSLIISTYGVFTMSLLIISMIVLLSKYLPDMKYLQKIEFEKFICFLLMAYCLFFISYDIFQKNTNSVLVETEKGRVYLPQKQADSINAALKYLASCTKKSQKILVLPEGTAINFLADREVNLHYHMFDRLYFEAIGYDKFIENLKNSDYEVILLAKGFGLTNFGKPYLYDDENDIVKYLKKNYFLDWKIEFVDKSIQSQLYCYVKPY